MTIEQALEKMELNRCDLAILSGREVIKIVEGYQMGEITWGYRYKEAKQERYKYFRKGITTSIADRTILECIVRNDQRNEQVKEVKPFNFGNGGRNVVKGS